MHEPDGGHLVTVETGLGGLVNDLAITPRGDVYVTDSVRPTLFRIRAEDVDARRNRAEAIPIDVQYTVSPQINGAFNVNGIVAVNDHEFIVGQTNVDKLFRVRTFADSTRSEVEDIALNEPVEDPDGIVLAEGTLFVVDNLKAQIVGIDLSDDQVSGTIVSRTNDPTFATPTGIAFTGDRLLVSNSQLFTVPPLPLFTITSLRLPVR